MGWVMLAMVKFSSVLLGWHPALTLTVCGGLALAYTVASGSGGSWSPTCSSSSPACWGH